MFAPTVKDIEQVAKQPAKLLTIKENATAAQAAKKMTDNHVGCLLVFNTQNEFSGLLTERDILAKVTTKHTPPHNSLVANIMTTDPISCTMDTPIETVEQLMAEHQIRHIPVLDNGQPVGMVSSRDLIAYQIYTNKAMKTAAEQLAMLSTKLKSLNLKETIALAIDEVPKNFEADRAVLCFPPKTSYDLVIYRKDCILSRKELLDPKTTNQLSKNPHVTSTAICEECSRFGGRAPKLIIPLSIDGQLDNNTDNNKNNHSFLCMCRFNSSSGISERLRLYKASLLQQILSLNLTNAKLYYSYQKTQQDSQAKPSTDAECLQVPEQALSTE